MNTKIKFCSKNFYNFIINQLYLKADIKYYVTSQLKLSFGEVNTLNLIFKI